MNAESSADKPMAMAALNRILDPRTGKGLADAGLVRGLVVSQGRAGFMLEVEVGDADLYAPVRAAAEAALKAMPGIDRAQVVLTADREPAQAPGTVRVRRGGALSSEAQAQLRPASRPSGAMKPAHVGHVIVVASGKGGVGKSTVAVNLACALAMLGRRTGLLDADVYGPSVPRMTGADGDPEVTPEKKLIPLQAWGLKLMSIGLLVDDAAPLIWRGPMATSALSQMLNDVIWGTEAEPLDILVVDMPPGTGDIQLSLAQKVAVSGAVVVSTPQEVALIDARRAITMFEKTRVPILGVVENMAYFADPSTGAPIEIFGRGGARAVAEKLGAPFLGEVPIEIALRQAGDDGRPLVATTPDSPAAKAFLAIAEAVLAGLEAAPARPAPTIVVED